MVIVRPAGANLGLPFVTISRAADAKTVGAFGLVYQSLPGLRSESEPTARDLYQSLPPPDRGLTIDSHIHDTVAGWCMIITVYNVENRRNHKGWWHGGGRCRKEKFFSSGRSACKLSPMVVKLVGQ